MKYVFLMLGLLGCAEVPPPDDEPVAGSVAVQSQVQPLTATITLDLVLQHFGTGTPTLTAVPGNTSYWKVNLSKNLYIKVGDTAYFPITHGYYSGLNAPLDELCKTLSGHKVYTIVNGAYAQGLNLEGKLVVRQ